MHISPKTVAEHDHRDDKMTGFALYSDSDDAVYHGGLDNGLPRHHRQHYYRGHGGENDPCEITDRIAVMLRQESGPYRTAPCSFPQLPLPPIAPTPSPPNPWNGQSSRPAPRPVDAACRNRMASWSYQIADYCSYRRDVVAQAMNLLDRYLSTPSARIRNIHLDRRQYQLASMTALYTAVKVTEAEVMDPKAVAGLSQGRFVSEDIVDMEREMLEAVRWKVTPPTAASFAMHFVELLRAALLPPRPDGPHEGGGRDKLSTLRELAKYQAELSVLESDLTVVPPSSIALAAVLNAVQSVYSPHILLLASNFLTRAVMGSPGLQQDVHASIVVESRRRLAGTFEEHAGYDMLALSWSSSPSSSNSHSPSPISSAPFSVATPVEPPHRASTIRQPCPSRFSAFGAVWRSLSWSSDASAAASSSSTCSSSSFTAAIDAKLVSEGEVRKHAEAAAQLARDSTSPTCVSKGKLSEGDY